MIGRESDVAAVSRQDNKALLWDILQSEGAFNRLPGQDPREAQEVLERAIRVCCALPEAAALTLVDLNKRILGEVIGAIGKSAKRPRPNASETLEQAASRHESDLRAAASPPKPNRPNFSDTLDGPIGDKMDGMLAAMVAERESQTVEAKSLHEKDPRTAALVHTALPVQQEMTGPSRQPTARAPLTIGAPIALSTSTVTTIKLTETTPQMLRTLEARVAALERANKGVGLARSRTI